VHEPVAGTLRPSWRDAMSGLLQNRTNTSQPFLTRTVIPMGAEQRMLAEPFWGINAPKGRCHQVSQSPVRLSGAEVEMEQPS
jgi:hypothetical protein